MQILCQFFLIQLLELLIGAGLLELEQLIYPKRSTGFGMLVFINSILIKFQAWNLPLFHPFSVIDGLECFWIGILGKNIELMLEFLKARFLFCFFCVLFLYLVSIQKK